MEKFKQLFFNLFKKNKRNNVEQILNKKFEVINQTFSHLMELKNENINHENDTWKEYNSSYRKNHWFIKYKEIYFVLVFYHRQGSVSSTVCYALLTNSFENFKERNSLLLVSKNANRNNLQSLQLKFSEQKAPELIKEELRKITTIIQHYELILAEITRIKKQEQTLIDRQNFCSEQNIPWTDYNVVLDVKKLTIEQIKEIELVLDEQKLRKSNN